MGKNIALDPSKITPPYILTHLISYSKGEMNSKMVSNLMYKIAKNASTYSTQKWLEQGALYFFFLFDWLVLIGLRRTDLAISLWNSSEFNSQLARDWVFCGILC